MVTVRRNPSGRTGYGDQLQFARVCVPNMLPRPLVTRRRTGGGGRRPGGRATATADPGELLSPSAVAKLVNVTEARVRAWRLYGAPWGPLRAVQVGTHHVFRRADVATFLGARDKHLDAAEAEGRRLPPGFRKPKPSR